MITKLHIDALVASRLALYGASKHFKNFDLVKVESIIRSEIESLCDLADPEVCLERFNFFNIHGTVESDYRERIIQLSDGSFFLAGIRFRGLDVTRPFISIVPQFTRTDELAIAEVSKLLKYEFNVFHPESFQISFPEDYEVGSRDLKSDRFTIVGKISELVKNEVRPFGYTIELEELSAMTFYEDYLREYNLFYKKFPHLKSEVKTESLESLNDSAQSGLLYKILINGNCAGIVAGYIEDYFGHKAVCILEELLFEDYRGRGLAFFVQKQFAQKMLGRFDFLWGHISELNPASLKTALKNGRSITEIEYRYVF